MITASCIRCGAERQMPEDTATWVCKKCNRRNIRVFASPQIYKEVVVSKPKKPKKLKEIKEDKDWRDYVDNIETEKEDDSD